MAGTTAQTIRNWEAGRHEPDSFKLLLLSARYETPMSHFLLEDEQPGALMVTRHRRQGRFTVDGARLAQARTDAGMTQSQVEQLTGISRRTISRYETGTTDLTPETLETLAAIYDRPWEWFTGDEPTVETDADDRSPESERPATSEVLDAYEEAKAVLTEDAERTIANFILFVRDRVLRRRHEDRNEQD